MNGIAIMMLEGFFSKLDDQLYEFIKQKSDIIIELVEKHSFTDLESPEEFGMQIDSYLTETIVKLHVLSDNNESIHTLRTRQHLELVNTVYHSETSSIFSGTMLEYICKKKSH